MKFNENQLKAINTRDKNITVSASAGAGKTTLLIERLRRRIINDRLSIDQILAMTFTEKAAADMKNKLSKSLHSMVKVIDQLDKTISKIAPKNTELKETISSLKAHTQKQVTLLPSAQISTIHSFCLSVIKEFGYLLSLDPQSLSNIFDDQQLFLMQSKALEETHQILFEKYQNDNDFYNVLNFFSYRINNFDSFNEAIMSIYETSQIQLDPQAYIDSIRKTYQSTSFDEYPEEIKDIIFKTILLKANKLNQQLDVMRDYYDFDERQLEKFDIWIKTMMSSNNQLISEIQAGNYHEAKQHLLFMARLENPGNQQTEYKKVRTTIMNEDLQELAKYFIIQEDITPLSKLIESLIEASEIYGQHFKLLKKELKGLDFSDIEQLAYKLLKDFEIVRETYQNQYKEIMIDEFQDTNHYQNAISLMISNGKNIFRVGDIKQSIYGFRNARPEIMMKFVNTVDDLNETIYLSQNYRSSKNIVEFSNILFENLMNIEGSSMRYKGDDIVSIGSPRQENITDKVEVHLIDKDQIVLYKPLNSSSFKDVKPSNSLRVAYYIAQDILKQVSENNVSFKDISVLIRNHSRKIDLKRAFDELGVPYYIEDKEGFYHAYSVQDISHFIQFILNPQDNISLFWVLQSGFFNFDENDLSVLALRSDTDSLWYQLKIKMNPVYQQLNLLRTNVLSLNEMDLVLNLLNFNRYYQDHLNKQERTNIDLFIQQLDKYLSKEHSGLIGFIKQLEFSIDTKTSTASSVSEDEDVVKVHTVHQSKGLEYPLTYFYAFKGSNKDQDIKKNFSIDDSGIAMKTPDFENLVSRNNLFREGINIKKQSGTISEEIRNLYVTLTRAENKLIIVDINQDVKDEKLNLSDLLNGESYTKLILRSLPRVKNDVYEILDDVKIHPIEVIRKVQNEDKELINEPMVEYPEIIEEPTELNLTLNLNSSYATSYGTLLHELIAQNRTVDDEKIKSTLTDFYNHPFTKELLSSNHTHEVPIAYRDINNQILYGYIDLLVEKDSEIILIDYKSDTIQSMNQLLNRYQEQMDRYYQGIKLVYPDKQISQFLYSFRLNDYIKVER